MFNSLKNIVFGTTVLPEVMNCMSLDNYDMLTMIYTFNIYMKYLGGILKYIACINNHIWSFIHLLFRVSY